MNVEKPGVLFAEGVSGFSGGGQFSLELLVKSLEQFPLRKFLWVPEDGPLSRALEDVVDEIFFSPPPQRIRHLFTSRTKLVQIPLLDFLQRNDIRIVHCNDSLTAACASRILPQHIRKVFHCRVPHSQTVRDRLLDRWFLEKMDRIIVVSQAVARRYGEDNPKVILVPNGIDLERFSPREKKFRIHQQFAIPRDSLLVCSTSRIHPGKKLELLIESLGKDMPENCHLVIAGDRETEPEYVRFLESLVSRLNLDSHVHFTGMVDSVPELLRDIDVLSVYTYGEAMSRSLLEGMAMGKAVIVSDDGGNVDLVKDNQNGLVAPLDDPGVFTRKLRLLLTDPVLRELLGRQARVTAEKFSLENCAAKVAGTYHELLFPR